MNALNPCIRAQIGDARRSATDLRGALSPHVRDLLGHVGLPPDVAETYPPSCQRMKQRACIAIAICLNPRGSSPTTDQRVVGYAPGGGNAFPGAAGAYAAVVLVGRLGSDGAVVDRLGVMYAGRLADRADRGIITAPKHPTRRC
jgi:ABC-type dipeptide/oligopeptide/nickel transport system ATPase component